MVELSEVVGGPVVNSYGVQDKVQEPELDPTMIVEDELFAVEAWEPCLICDTADEHEIMFCDGCDKTVHVFCAGYDVLPEVYYCETCIADLENDLGLPGMAAAVRRRPRLRTGTQSSRPRARRTNDQVWARVWQEVSRRLDLDLDFPFDEEPGDQRTEEQRREFARWQRRFEVANQQGAANRLRGIANARLQPESAIRPAPESQEVVRAWNAFDKARESQDAPSSIRKRKRKSTDSPASPQEPEVVEQLQQKRPRLRPPPLLYGQDQGGETSVAPARPAADEPTFLSSLLHEVESKPTARSPDASDHQIDQYSPLGSSRGASPSSSGYATPRAISVTPPPNRPLSPPLSSTIVPISSPFRTTFSPFSPADLSRDSDHVNGLHHRGRRRSSQQDSHDHAPKERASSTSPSRGLSYSAKEEVQRMVKLSLSPRYRDKEISKDQYTEINRDVSRKLYELVGNASALTDQAEREKWQSVADDEVKKAVVALSALTLFEE